MCIVNNRAALNVAGKLMLLRPLAPFHLSYHRRASRRFTEVVSNGPTAIPPEEDVTAAISSVLAADDLGFGQPTRQPQQEIPQVKPVSGG